MAEELIELLEKREQWERWDHLSDFLGRPVHLPRRILFEERVERTKEEERARFFSFLRRYEEEEERRGEIFEEMRKLLQSLMLKCNYLLPTPLAEVALFAMLYHRPLLLEGEPAVGKTEFALKLAESLGIPIEVATVKTIFDYERLVYSIDWVKHLNLKLPIEKCIIEGPMLRAFEKSWEGPVVLLLDEVDKAPESLLNDLLMELDRYKVFVPETGQEFSAKAENLFIIMTSNATKPFPETILSRVVYFYIEFPSKREIVEILKVHGFPEAIAEVAAEKIIQYRNLDLDKSPYRQGIREAILLAHAIRDGVVTPAVVAGIMKARAHAVPAIPEEAGYRLIGRIAEMIKDGVEAYVVAGYDAWKLKDYMNLYPDRVEAAQEYAYPVEFEEDFPRVRVFYEKKPFYIFSKEEVEEMRSFLEFIKAKMLRLKYKEESRDFFYDYMREKDIRILRRYPVQGNVDVLILELKINLDIFYVPAVREGERIVFPYEVEFVKFGE